MWFLTLSFAVLLETVIKPLWYDTITSVADGYCYDASAFPSQAVFFPWENRKDMKCDKKDSRLCTLCTTHIRRDAFCGTARLWRLRFSLAATTGGFVLKASTYIGRYICIWLHAGTERKARWYSPIKDDICFTFILFLPYPTIPKKILFA